MDTTTTLTKYDHKQANIEAILLLTKLGMAHPADYRDLCQKSLAKWGLGENGKAVFALHNGATAWAGGGDAATFKRLYDSVIRGAVHMENTGLHRMTS